MSNWNPKETAPQDGTIILAMDETDLYLCMWDEEYRSDRNGGRKFKGFYKCNRHGEKKTWQENYYKRWHKAEPQLWQPVESFSAKPQDVKSILPESQSIEIDNIFKLIKAEREKQDLKYGSLESKNQSVAGYLLIIRKELEEAENGWKNNIQGKHSSLSEIKQIAAVAVACLQQHGIEGN